MKHEKNDTNLTSRVYVYGTVPARIAPPRNEDLALTQMRLGNRLWNVLVAIDRARIARYRLIMRDEAQERIEQLRQKAGAIRQEIKQRRQQARKRSVPIDDLMEPLTAIKVEVSALIDQQRRTSAERHEARRAELTALQERTGKRIVRARQAAGRMGLFWGSYNDIIQRADTGRKHGGELHFRSFRGEGTVTAQIMGGAPVERCVDGGHGFFQVDPPTAGQRWRYARMRIGSNPDRSPIWLEIPIVYHRDLPPHANIKSVSMTRRLLAGKVKWQLNVTLNMLAAEPKTTGGAIAIDVGWRLRPEGIRVAYWIDDDGRAGQVLVPAGDVSEFGRVSSLRATCDRSRDEMLPAISEWLAGQELPAEWARRSAFIGQWRSTDRLADLVAWWRDNRLPGDEETFGAAIDWRKQYLHLSNWSRNLQDQLVLRVRDRYRVFAAEVARKYSTVFIEEFDLRKVAEKPAAEAGVTGPGGTNRQMVSPSTFRGALLNAVRREGLRVVALPAEYTTRQCHACGFNGEWDAAAELLHKCARCEALWDQDMNAAWNLLHRGLGAAMVMA